jgi:hypothetical protein
MRLSLHGSTLNGMNDANGEEGYCASLNPLETLESEEKTAL